MLEILNHLFAAVCGQNPDHTWAPGGILLPCCQRCLGLYAGAAVAIAMHWWLRPRLTTRFLEVHGAFLLLMAPFGFHWVPQGPALRTITGMLFGFGVVTYLWLPVNRVFHRRRARMEDGVWQRRLPSAGAQSRSADLRSAVAQACGLQASVRDPRPQTFELSADPGPADWKSAIQQTGGLRYAGGAPSATRGAWQFTPPLRGLPVYAWALAAALVLVPLLAARGGTIAADLLSALAACGAVGLACLVLANVIVGCVGTLRLVRRLRSIPRGCVSAQP
jgi:uncharacterized membrane protein